MSFPPGGAAAIPAVPGRSGIAIAIVFAAFFIGKGTPLAVAAALAVAGIPSRRMERATATAAFLLA